MERQQGIGLTEFLVSFALSSLLLTMLVQHYLSRKHHYQKTQTVIENTLELQLVSDLIRDSARKAGFTPCLSINALKTIDRRYEKTNLLAIEPNAGRHRALRMQRMDENFSKVLEIVGPTELLITPGLTYKPKQAVLIADCYHAEVQHVVSIHKTIMSERLIIQKPLLFNYVGSIYIGEWVSEEFFTQPNERQELSLFYKTYHAEELSPFVKSLSASLKVNQGKTFLQVTLELENDQKFRIEANVRAS